MSAYGFLAGSYDELTEDVNYPAWADYVEKHFRRCRRSVRTVLDLACGTGSLTRELCLRGYEVIGVDQSPEMLARAEEKCRDLPGEPPLLLCQSMDRLDLYDTVDACVCCLDSVNYVTSPSRLEKAFQRVHLFLNPGGLFLFDINTVEKLESLDGQVFLDEREDVYCVWRTEYSRRTRLCRYFMDIFRLDPGSGLWQRGEELHEERSYPVRELTDMLKGAGFQKIRVYGDRKLRAPQEGEGRIFFVAGKGTAPLVPEREGKPERSGT